MEQSWDSEDEHRSCNQIICSVGKLTLMEFYILISPGQCDALNGYNSYLKGAKCWALRRLGGACSFFGNMDYELGLSPVDAMQYGRFSEAGLLEWMRFVIFKFSKEVARGRSALPGRFLSRRCFTLCITVEVETRIANHSSGAVWESRLPS